MKNEMVIRMNRSVQKANKINRTKNDIVRFRARNKGGDISFQELKDFSCTHNLVVKFCAKATKEEKDEQLAKLRSKGIIIPFNG